jgi:hypothetical protein
VLHSYSASRLNAGRIELSRDSDPVRACELASTRQIVFAERVLRFTSPLPEAPHGKARVRAVYPDINLLLPDSYGAVFERIAARAVRATNVVPVDFHVSPSRI